MLTATQLATLSTDIAANTNQIGGVQIKNLAHTADNAFAVADWYNQLCAVDFFGNYSSVPVSILMNNISWKNFTPADAVPTDTQLNVEIWQARALFCQGYQFNLQTMLTGRTTFDATKASNVAGLKDATNTNMPSGSSGAGQKGGWSSIQPILCRKATNGEKLFADISGGTGADNTHAATFVFEGTVQLGDINSIWGI